MELQQNDRKGLARRLFRKVRLQSWNVAAVGVSDCNTLTVHDCVGLWHCWFATETKQAP